MILKIIKFGKILVSRPAGKEALMTAKEFLLVNNNYNEITLDFADVEVLAPAWADEFISGIKDLYNNKSLKFVNTENESVAETMKVLGYQ